MLKHTIFTNHIYRSPWLNQFKKSFSWLWYCNTHFNIIPKSEPRYTSTYIHVAVYTNILCSSIHAIWGVVRTFYDWIIRSRAEPLVMLFPRYRWLVCWKPVFCAHRVWRNSSFYQEVQRFLCDWRDGGIPWTTHFYQILFQVRENCYRMLWNVEDSFWGTSYGSFPNISVVFPV